MRSKKCYLCGHSFKFYYQNNFPHKLFAITKDHVVPLSRGGLDHYTNIRLTHSICNAEKGNEEQIYHRMRLLLARHYPNLPTQTGSKWKRAQKYFSFIRNDL